MTARMFEQYGVQKDSTGRYRLDWSLKQTAWQQQQQQWVAEQQQQRLALLPQQHVPERHQWLPDHQQQQQGLICKQEDGVEWHSQSTDTPMQTNNLQQQQQQHNGVLEEQQQQQQHLAAVPVVKLEQPDWLGHMMAGFAGALPVAAAASAFQSSQQSASPETPPPLPEEPLPPMASAAAAAVALYQAAPAGAALADSTPAAGQTASAYACQELQCCPSLASCHTEQFQLCPGFDSHCSPADDTAAAQTAEALPRQQQQQQQQQLSLQTISSPPLPALPDVPPGCCEVSEHVMDAVIDMLNVLHKEFPGSGIDVVSCVETLGDISEQPEAAKRFMRTGYKLLASAVRVDNKAQVLDAVKRYLARGGSA
jgi:hypothetical protein